MQNPALIKQTRAVASFQEADICVIVGLHTFPHAGTHLQHLQAATTLHKSGDEGSAWANSMASRALKDLECFLDGAAFGKRLYEVLTQGAVAKGEVEMGMEELGVREGFLSVASSQERNVDMLMHLDISLKRPIELPLLAQSSNLLIPPASCFPLLGRQQFHPPLSHHVINNVGYVLKGIGTF